MDFAIGTYADYDQVHDPAELASRPKAIWKAASAETLTFPEPTVLMGNTAITLPHFRSPELVLSVASNVLCAPRNVMIDFEGRLLLPDSFRKPNSPPNEPWLERKDDATFHIEQIPGKRTVLPGRYYHVGSRHRGDGHFMFEALSRLWAIDHVDRAGLKFLAPHKISTFGFELLRPFGILRQDIVALDRPYDVERLFVAKPSYAIDRGMTQHFGSIAETIGAFYESAEDTPERIYVSRRGTSQRRLLNEEDVERLFEAHGFHIIHPQDMPVSVQVGLFRGARFVAGPVGSGMYNAVFSKAGTRRLVLAPDRFWTPNDVVLGSKLGAELMYCYGTGASGSKTDAMKAEWSIDTVQLGRVLSALL